MVMSIPHGKLSTQKFSKSIPLPMPHSCETAESALSSRIAPDIS